MKSACQIGLQLNMYGKVIHHQQALLRSISYMHCHLMVPFKLPVVFTIGPQEPFPPAKDVEALVPHNAHDKDADSHRKRIREEAYQSFMTYADKMSGLSRR